MADSRSEAYQYMSVMASLINRMGGQLLPGDDNEIVTSTQYKRSALSEPPALGVTSVGDTVVSDMVKRLAGAKQGWIIDFTKSGGERYEIDNIMGDNSLVQWVENYSTAVAGGREETGVSAPDGAYRVYLQQDMTGEPGTLTMFVTDRNSTYIYAPDSEKNYNQPGYFKNPQTGSDVGNRVDFKKVAKAQPSWFAEVEAAGGEGESWVDYVQAIPEGELGDDEAGESIKASWRLIDGVYYGMDQSQIERLDKEYSPIWKKNTPSAEGRPIILVNTTKTDDGKGTIYTYGYSENEITDTETVYPPEWAGGEEKKVKKLQKDQQYSFVEDNVRYVWNHAKGDYDAFAVEFERPEGEEEFRTINNIQQQWNPATGIYENIGAARHGLPEGLSEFRKVHGMVQQWNPATGTFDRVTDVEQPQERLLRTITDDEGGWIVDQYGFIDPETKQEVITAQDVREPIRDPILSIEQMYSQSLAEAERLDMSDPSYARAQTLWDFKNQPTSQERLQMALEIAQSPSDYMTLVGLYTGEIMRENPATVGQRIAPLAPMLQQLAKKFFLNIPGINEDKLNPLPPNVIPAITGITAQAVSDTERQDTGQVVGEAGQPTTATPTIPQQIVQADGTTAYPAAADSAYTPTGTQGLTPADEQNRIDGKPYISKSGIRIGTTVAEEYIPTSEEKEKYRTAYTGDQQKKMMGMIDAVGGVSNIANIKTLHQAAMGSGNGGKMSTVSAVSPTEETDSIYHPAEGEPSDIGKPHIFSDVTNERIRLEALKRTADALQTRKTEDPLGASGEGEDFHEGGVVGGSPGQQRTIDVLAGETVLTQPQITKLLSMAGITGQTWQPQQGNQFRALTRPASTQIPGQLIGGARPRSLQTMRQMSPTQQRLYKPLVESFGVPYEDYEWQESKISDIGGSKKQRASFRPSSIRGLNA